MTEKNQITTGRQTLTTSADLLNALSDEDKKQLAKFVVSKQLELEANAANLAQKQAMAQQSVNLHVQTFNSLRQQDSSFRSGHTIHQEIDTGTGKMNISSHTGSSCFVETVAYQDTHHPDVEYLRRFRDQYLAKTRVGLRFIYWYYRKAGPTMADFVKNRPLLRGVSHVALRTLVRILKTICPAKP